MVLAPMLALWKPRLKAGAGTFLSSGRSFASHYDVLGVTPKSTQSDIKAAYYKLSKVYHPDKSTDETSSNKFRAISEAYEVLGNVKLKKMYDKGLIVGKTNTSRMTPEAEEEPTDPSLKFYKSRIDRHVVPTMDGKTPIYDFDAWAKNHYSTLYEKSQYDKEFVRRKKARQAEAVVAQQQEAIMALVLLFGSVFIMLVVNGTADYDQDKIPKTKSNSAMEGSSVEP